MDKAKYTKDGWLVSAVIAKQVCDELNDNYDIFSFNYTIEKKYIHIYFTYHKKFIKKIGFINQETLDFHVSKFADGKAMDQMERRIKYHNISESKDDIQKVVVYLITSKINPWKGVYVD